MSSIKRLTLIISTVFAALSVTAQVDGEVSKPDTIYIFEDEVTYDTLYLQGSETNSLLSKEEVLEAFQKSGVGELYYKKGHYWITGSEETYKLDKTDLQMLFSPAQYESYRKAKTGQYVSIPLYVLGGGAAAIAGIGLVQFGMSFIEFAKAGTQFNDELAFLFWQDAMRGVFMVGGGLFVATAFFVPAIILSVKSKVRLNRIAEEFNTPSTSLRLSFGPTPVGVGVSLSF
jgi:hypothetical protein